MVTDLAPLQMGVFPGCKRSIRNYLDHHGPLGASRRRLGGWADSHLPPLHGVTSANNTCNVDDGKDLRNAAFLQDGSSGGKKKR